MRPSRAAFTLIEITLAIAIALIVFAVAVPAIGSLMGGKGLEQTFRDFDAFVRKAQDRAIAEHRDFVLIWEKDGITLEPNIPNAEDGNAQVDTYPSNGAEITLQRVFALDQNAAGEWPIWKSGVCEPVRIVYRGDLGEWVAEYDPLTARGRVLKMEEK